MIKNIIFDMGGVLIRWNPETMLNEAGLSEEEKKILFDVAFNNYRWSLVDAGYYKTEQDFLDAIENELPEKLMNIMRNIMLDFGDTFMTLIPGMEELVCKLKKNGYKIYLLSNAGPGHHKYWGKIPASKYFDDVMVSALVKMVKPEKAIYEHALKTFNAKAEESVFIDDLAINCAGAFRAGIFPINFKSPAQLIKELDKLGVNCN